MLGLVFDGPEPYGLKMTRNVTSGRDLPKFTLSSRSSLVRGSLLPVPLHGVPKLTLHTTIHIHARWKEGRPSPLSIPQQAVLDDLSFFCD